MLLASKACRQLRQLGDIRRDPSRRCALHAARADSDYPSWSRAYIFLLAFRSYPAFGGDSEFPLRAGLVVTPVAVEQIAICRAFDNLR